MNPELPLARHTINAAVFAHAMGAEMPFAVCSEPDATRYTLHTVIHWAWIRRHVACADKRVACRMNR